MMERINGRIIRISRKGWGFISSKEIQFTQIFFHWTALRGNTIPFLGLKVGMIVEFTPVQVEGKGWRAVHIKVLEDETEQSATDRVSSLQE